MEKKVVLLRGGRAQCGRTRWRARGRGRAEPNARRAQLNSCGPRRLDSNRIGSNSGAAECRAPLGTKAIVSESWRLRRRWRRGASWAPGAAEPKMGAREFRVRLTQVCDIVQTRRRRPPFAALPWTLPERDAGAAKLGISRCFVQAGAERASEQLD